MSEKTRSKEADQEWFQDKPSDQQISEPSPEETSEEKGVSERSCSECGSTDLITDKGEIVCGECGVIQGDEIDHSAEWRAYSSEEQNEKSRVGAPLTETLHDKGLTTQISWENTDSFGNSLSERKRKQMGRLRRWQQIARTRDSTDKNLQHALGEVKRMAAALGIPDDVQEVASVIYRRALSEDLIRGRSIEGVATAALYAACRKSNIPRSLEEMDTVSRVEEQRISRAYNYIDRELGLDVAPTNPKEYLPRFSSKLDLDHETQEKARKILDVAIEEGLHSGRSPTSIAASALYAAGLLNDDKITQDEVAEVANVSAVTIRNRYKEQLEVIDFPHT